MPEEIEFAKKFNQLTWEYLEKSNRDSEDDLRMVNYAHASLAHWISAGGPIEKLRGLWLLSRVYCFLEDKKQASMYAQLCNHMTEENRENAQDFDLAYAAEALARAYALAGEIDLANTALIKAEMLGNMIQNEEDREIYLKDLESGPWFGLRKNRHKFCHG